MIPSHNTYLGKRIKRGLFRSAKGILINADVNGAYNILRKVFPKALTYYNSNIEGIVGVGLHPKCISII